MTPVKSEEAVSAFAANMRALSEPAKPDSALPLVSVVMCTYHRPEMLRDAMESLVAQETDGKFNFEIVVVGNAKDTLTMQVLDEFAQTTSVAVRAIDEPRRGQVIARNRALVEARGEWLAHFDDDQIASPRWLAELMATATARNAKVVGGSLYLKLPEDCQRELTYVCRRMLGQSVEWNTVQPYTRKEGPGTGNIMIHRTVLDQVGHYDESFQLRGYDTDLFRRIREAGYQAWFTPLALGYHVTPPDRLEDEYFRETCLHNGWSFARRDRLEMGSIKMAAMMVARIGQALLMHVPRRVAAGFSGSEEKLLTAKCRLWRTEGYVRSSLYAMFPRLFPQRSFFAKYEFRAEQVAARNSGAGT